ncbi:Nicotinamidase-related amidase [Chitinophaga jiangningensis]|uniref:Nicotinamidase-related amidase n=1 Tax=Chitinophaga jiangningensis TaxID=1419482 RepID=A0A1M7J6L2_9BACT|nr:isochorismatase family cysteine hydrolase [Chitinophaga jiangningensis]SHM48548.1 Nicotinamidase-related amidase [Chitinophaga jiangningensis]
MAHTKENTALLVLDMQEVLLSTLPGADKLTTPIANAIAHARGNNLPVVYVAVGFKKGFPEIHPDHRTFGKLPATMGSVPPEVMTKILPALAPQNNEPVVIKKRFSAFAGSDLEMILRSQGIRHLVLCGVITSGVVLSTALEAADKDFNITILSDGCLDRDEELHEVLMRKLFPKYMEVMSSEGWISQSS